MNDFTLTATQDLFVRASHHFDQVGEASANITSDWITDQLEAFSEEANPFEVITVVAPVRDLPDAMLVCEFFAFNIREGEVFELDVPAFTRTGVGK